MEQAYKIYAVYDANGTVAGELAYMIGKFRGTRHCALCDITHGWNPLGRPEWRRAQRLTSTVTWIHRDEQPDAIRQATEDSLPAVVLSDTNQTRILLDAASLAECDGNYQKFEALLTESLSEALAVS